MRETRTHGGITSQRYGAPWAWAAGLLALAWSLAPTARAQMEFSLEETEQAPSEEGEGAPDEQAPAEEATAPEGEETGGEEGGDVIGELAGEEQLSEGEREQAPRVTETVEEIYAVQRIYALRLNRMELAPSLAFSLNDPYVNRMGLGLALNYWWTNVLAVGVSTVWYKGIAPQGLSDLAFQVLRATRLAVPTTEWLAGAHLNFTYVPVYGKFAMFNEFIFQWDAYVVGGVGAMFTRPVAVVDQDFRKFDKYGFRFALNAGLGLRIFVTRWLTVFGELRDYIYLERLENLDVQPDRSWRGNPDNWLGGTEVVNNVSVQVGATIYFPFTFEYRLPK